MSDELSVIGISHRTAPLERRERFALDAAGAARLLEGLGPEAFLLVTCNRTELYGVRESPTLLDALLSTTGGGEREDFYEKQGAEVARHLFAVAAGLDSMVVGEHQILGQVKRALSRAQSAGALGPVLGELVRRAIAVGRRVRRETEIGSGLPSIPRVATGMARFVLGDLQHRRLLILGSGKLGTLTAGLLRRSGASEVTVTNRSADAAARLAADIGGRAAPFEDLDRLLVESDIVITCTAAQSAVLSRDRVASAMAERRERKLVVIDIAVPRDVDPEVRALRGVRLYDLDDLRGWGSSSLEPATIRKADAIVDAEAEEFLAWQAARAAVPTIRELRERAERILDRELAAHPAGASAEMREFGRRLLAKMLHEPLVHLRAGAAASGPGYLTVARDLFGLDSDAGAANGRPPAPPDPPRPA